MRSERASETGTIPVVIKGPRDRQSRVEALLDKFASEGIELKVVMRCESPEVVKEFVRQGAGMGFLYYNPSGGGPSAGNLRRSNFQDSIS